VGVDRSPSLLTSGSTSRPHARGGGPVNNVLDTDDIESSPRAWGWTVAGDDEGLGVPVVPTRVGVDRRGSRTAATGAGRPHARGGGPSGSRSLRSLAPSSPRAWGWTGPAPARVEARSRRPHARGGGPMGIATKAVNSPSSPRAWGWTVVDELVGPLEIVVPTRVGVDRRSSPRGRRRRRRPHARGGGPRPRSTSATMKPSSPRAWGWTGRSEALRRSAAVVPTRVGVDRARTRHRTRSSSRPHARGGGPLVALPG